MKSSMDSKCAVEAWNISKEYKIFPTSFSRFKEAAFLGKRSFHRSVWALRDVSIQVKKGKALGLIGANGAGKSTFLKILAGTTIPSTGGYKINGKVASLLELGTGFHSEFSGRDNIYLSASVQGFSKKEIRNKIDGILEFAELGEFIDQPIRTYSSGMIMRLGFSVATAIDPEILIIDEILAVGDLHFQKKCVDRIYQFKKDGKSIIFCSHSLFDVRQICDDVVWFKDGRMEERGDPLKVTNNYANYERGLTTNDEIHTGGREVLNGSEQPVIKTFSLLDGEGKSSPDVVKTGEDLTLALEFRIPREGYPANVGVGIFRTDNILVATFSSLFDGMGLFTKPGDYRILLHLPKFRVMEGEYTVVAYVFDQNGIHIYDHLPTEKRLIVTQEQNQPGLVSLDHEWEI